MQAQVINLAKVRASNIQVTDNHESIKESYDYRTLLASLSIVVSLL